MSDKAPDTRRIASTLESWLQTRLDDAGRSWLRGQREQIAAGGPEWHFFTAFSSVPRRLGKADLALTPDECRAAEEARFGWDPKGWSVDQAGRTLLVLSFPSTDVDAYHDALSKIFETADVGESIALYQALPLLPHPRRWVFRATEGIRSNMRPVFEAVALRNPYPGENFDESQWNQMVLKAIFVGSPLSEIRGLEERGNPMLARMLRDFAHERWAARRPVTPELWRMVGRFAGDDWVPDLERVLMEGTPTERQAAALALSDSPSGMAQRILSNQPELSGRIARGELSWRHVAEVLQTRAR